MGTIPDFVKSVISAVIAFILSCSIAVSNFFYRDEIKPIRPNPNPQVMAEEQYKTNFLDVPCETDYRNITINKIDGNVSNLKASQIVFELKNHNKGKGFYYYYIPFVEFYQNGEWIRLSYYPIETRFDEEWYFCAETGNSNKEFGTKIIVNTKYIKERLIAGKYRIAQFVGPTVVYCEFEIK